MTLSSFNRTKGDFEFELHASENVSINVARSADFNLKLNSDSAQMKVEAPGNTTTYLKTCLNNETFE
jgi:hypothetical protein